MDCFGRCKRKLKQSTLVSPKNPHSLREFKSEKTIREEQERQLKVNGHVIHPYSTFRAWYQMYLILLYAVVLATKPIDAAFMKKRFYNEAPYYREFTIAVDFLCWIDIVLNFLTGYVIYKPAAVIVLTPAKIATHYMLGPFFICDVLSSVPKGAFYYKKIKVFQIYGVVSILALFKIVRLFSLVSCMNSTAQYFRIKSRGVLFLFCALVTSITIFHWMACLQFAVPRILRRYFSKEMNYNSWILNKQVRAASLYTQYVFCFLRSSAFILGIRIDTFRKNTLLEDITLEIITYIVGKILIGCIWVILAVAILSSRSIDIKFLEIMNQLEEFFKATNIPMNLRKRISDYYKYKFKEKFFREEKIALSLSSSIATEITVHVRKSLITNIPMFSELNQETVSKVLECLKPEIYLPGDLLICHGNDGDAMYFLITGTVAVYTRSGKEVCHLGDGDYFGEICLIIQGEKRTANVRAVETTHVYRLNRSDFNKHLLGHKRTMKKMISIAQSRLNETLEIEENYIATLFRRSSTVQRRSLRM